jgi:hypothetical protein
MDENQEYRERYCAFLDILGFCQLVEQVGEHRQKFIDLKTLLQKVHSSKSDDALEKAIKSQSISDAVALSALVTPSGLSALFRTVKLLYIDLFCQGYFLRGAIVRGQLYHDGQTIFGSALVRAYHFESEIARFPRVVVTGEVREDMLQYAAQSKPTEDYPKIAEELRQSVDGPMYLHVLGPVAALLKNKNSPYAKLTDEEKENAARYENIKTILQERYASSMDNPRHFKKVRWFANYWNTEIPDGYGLRIGGAGLDIRVRPGTLSRIA